MKEEYTSDSEVAILNNITLRPYQEEAKIKIFEAWEEHNSVMFQMPTGTGKTILFSSIIRDLHDLGTVEKRAIRVLVLAHRKELIDQISESLGRKYGVGHGIIKADYPEEMSIPNQVASVQTLSRRLKKWGEKDFDFIIIDEAHHALAETYVNIIETFPNAKILGVTATPYRLKRQPFTDIFNTLITSKSIKDFINDKHLCDYKYFSIKPSSFIQKAIDNIDDFDIGGDYANAAMSMVCDNRKVRAGVYETYCKYAKGKKGIVYTINQQHNHNLAEKFKENGIRVETIDSKTKANLRNEIVKRFRKGDIDVLFNVNIFSEGFDCPDVEFILLARPTMSLSLYLQQVGRGFRTHKGKEEVLLLDNVGSYNRFGLPSARRKWQYHFDGDKHWQDKGVFEVDKTDKHSVNFFDIVEGDEETDLIYASQTEEKDNTEEVNLELEDITTEQEEVKTRENQPSGYVSRGGIALDFEYKGYRVYFNADIKKFEASNLVTEKIEYRAFGQGQVKKWIDDRPQIEHYRNFAIIDNKEEDQYDIINSHTNTKEHFENSSFKARAWIDQLLYEEIYKGYKIIFDRLENKYVAIYLEKEEDEHYEETVILTKQWIDKVNYKEVYKGFEISYDKASKEYVTIDLTTGEEDRHSYDLIKVRKWISSVGYKKGYRGFEIVFNHYKNRYIATKTSKKEEIYDTLELDDIKQLIDKVNCEELYKGFKIKFDGIKKEYIAINLSTNKNQFDSIEITHIKKLIDKITYIEYYKDFKIMIDEFNNNYYAINQLTNKKLSFNFKISEIKEWIDDVKSKENHKEIYNGFAIIYDKNIYKYVAIRRSTNKREYNDISLFEIKKNIDKVNKNEGYKVISEKEYKGYEIKFDTVKNRYLAINQFTGKDDFYSDNEIKIREWIDSSKPKSGFIENYKGFSISFDNNNNQYVAKDKVGKLGKYNHKILNAVKKHIDIIMKIKK